MAKSSDKPSKSRARRTKVTTLATKDAVKREKRSPQPEATLIGALFSSQVAVARLMFQFSPLAAITAQQAIILDTLKEALNGALEDPKPNDDSA